jgi:hypothetical protein
MLLRKPYRHGMALGTTLAICLVACLLAFTLVEVTVAHGWMALGFCNSQSALFAADSAVAEAGAILLQQRTFGQSLLVGLNGSQATLSFNSTVPVFSVNRLDQGGSIGCYGHNVPPNAAQLCATATNATVSRAVEMLISDPPFDFDIASVGPVNCRGGVDVLGVDSFAHLGSGVNSIPATALRPGNVGSDNNLSFTGSNYVTGNAQATGSVLLSQATTVLGAVQSDAAYINVPQLIIANYDDQSKPSVSPITPGTYSSGLLTLEGYNRCAGDLTISEGLKLDGAVLFVTGSAVIHGGLQGTGALVVMGTTQIDGPCSMTADDIGAILSQSDVTLRGTSAQNAQFNGLIYTYGNLSASDIQLCGLFMSATAPSGTTWPSGPPAGASLSMSNVNLVECTQAANLDIPVTVTTTASPTPPYIPAMNNMPLAAMNTSASSAVSLQGGPRIDPTRIPKNGSGQYVMPSDPWSVLVWDITYQYGGGPPILTGGTKQQFFSWIQGNCQILGQRTPTGVTQIDNIINNLPLQTSQQIGVWWWDASGTFASMWNLEIGPGDSDSALVGYVQQAVNNLNQSASSSSTGSGSTTTSTTTDQWTINLSNFIDMASQARVVYWAEH